MKEIILVIIGLITLPVMAHAHPGHGIAHDTILHYLSSPIHMFSFLAVVGFVLYVLIRKSFLIKKRN